MRQLREENRKRKQLVADPSLDKHILRDSLKKILKPKGKRRWVNWAQDVYQISKRRAFVAHKWKGQDQQQNSAAKKLIGTLKLHIIGYYRIKIPTF